MDCAQIRFTLHALQRSDERGLSQIEIAAIVERGEIIREYPDDQPWPSYLVLGFDGSTPIHVVVAREPEERTCLVVTAYVPTGKEWSEDFSERRPR